MHKLLQHADGTYDMSVIICILFLVGWIATFILTPFL
jgi:uncharacterized membrane protein YciS (DUF1049 family)